jgi:hypothetical protein
MNSVGRGKRVVGSWKLEVGSGKSTQDLGMRTAGSQADIPNVGPWWFRSKLLEMSDVGSGRHSRR